MKLQRFTLVLRALITCAILVSGGIITATPQATQQNPIPFPIIPLIVEYDYAPQYFLQRISDHPRYSLIEAKISKGEPPIYELILTEKTTRRQVDYSNSEPRVKALLNAGKEARLAKIDFQMVTKVGEQPTYGFGFSDEQGQAVRWRFIPASEVSQKGSGLTRQSGGPGLRLLYTEIGTLAGAGTAVQIGDKISEAEPWPEVSFPPYFIAYHGLYIEGHHKGLFTAGGQRWRVTSAPTDLKQGSQWTLTDEQGRTRNLRITARQGDELTIDEINPHAPHSTSMTITAQALPNELALRSLLLGSSNHTMRITFKPDLNLSAFPTEPGGAEVAFQVDFDRHERVVQGSVSGEKRNDSIQLRWQPKSPDWAKAQVLNTVVTTDRTGYKIELR